MTFKLFLIFAGVDMELSIYLAIICMYIYIYIGVCVDLYMCIVVYNSPFIVETLSPIYNPRQQGFVDPGLLCNSMPS